MALWIWRKNGTSFAIWVEMVSSLQMKHFRYNKPGFDVLSAIKTRCMLSPVLSLVLLIVSFQRKSTSETVHWDWFISSSSANHSSNTSSSRSHKAKSIIFFHQLIYMSEPFFFTVTFWVRWYFFINDVAVCLILWNENRWTLCQRNPSMPLI